MRPLNWSAIARTWALASLLACGGASVDAATTTQFDVTGQVVTPRTFDLPALDSLPQTTQTVGFLSGSTPQTHVYSGPTLWSVVNAAGLVVDTGVNNDVLNKVVVARGSDGYQVVYSMGELSPNFGNRGALVATRETVAGRPAPLADDGFARSTAPGDVRGGRYVSNLADIAVLQASTPIVGGTRTVSTSFTVGGDVLHPGSFDLAALQALPAVQRTAGANTFTGVSFWSLLNDVVGLRIDANVKNDVLNMYVVATASDGYRVAFSLGELNPLFGNAPDLIAYAVDGAGLGSNGFARIVAPDDVLRGRYLSNLVALDVFHAVPVPEPGAGALLASGLALLGWVASRRERAQHLHGRS